MAGSSGRIDVENVNHPGSVRSVDAARYGATRDAMLLVLPPDPPGLTYDGLLDAVRARLPGDLFPYGEKSGWWVKTVQLDLEAKGLVARTARRPLRWYRV